MTKPRAVYLDYNATAPLRPAALAAMTVAFGLTGNPSSVHRFGRVARRTVELARAQVASLVGARPPQVVFTSGGTEANNLALQGTDRDRILISAVEHDSVRQAILNATIVPVTSDGVVDLAALKQLLNADPRPTLVSLMLANNETGVIQPVAAAAAIARANGALVHCDTVQAVGKIAVEFEELGVDLMSLSAHKFGGPQGCGALVVRDDVLLTPLLRGGGQEFGRRAGTENVAAIAGFGAAAVAAEADLGKAGELAALRDALEARLRDILPAVALHGATAPRLPNTSCIGLSGVTAEIQVVALDLAGIAVSAGAACSSGKVRPSQVLASMGVPTTEAGCAIRVSLGWQSTADDVDRFVEAWRGLSQHRHLTGAAA